MKHSISNRCHVAAICGTFAVVLTLAIIIILAFCSRRYLVSSEASKGTKCYCVLSLSSDNVLVKRCENNWKLLCIGDTLSMSDSICSVNNDIITVVSCDGLNRVYELLLDSSNTIQYYIRLDENNSLSIFAKIIMSKYSGAEVEQKVEFSGNGLIDRGSDLVWEDSVAVELLSLTKTLPIENVSISVISRENYSYFEFENSSDKLYYFFIVQKAGTKYNILADVPSEYLMLPPHSIIPVEMFKFLDTKGCFCVFMSLPIDYDRLQNRLSYPGSSSSLGCNHSILGVYVF